MRTCTMQFRWNIPYRFDEAEEEVTVLFDYTPGTPGWQMKHPHDPDCDPPVVENVRYVRDDGMVIEPCADEYDAMEAACWDEVASRRREGGN